MVTGEHGASIRSVRDHVEQEYRVEFASAIIHHQLTVEVHVKVHHNKTDSVTLCCAQVGGYFIEFSSKN